MNIYKIYDLKERLLKALGLVREGVANRNDMLLKLNDVIKNRPCDSQSPYPYSSTTCDDADSLSKKLKAQVKILSCFDKYSKYEKISNKLRKEETSVSDPDRDRIINSFDFTEVECLRQEVSDTFGVLLSMVKDENRFIEELIGLWYEFIRTDRVLSCVPKETESAICRIDSIIRHMIANKYGEEFMNVLTKADIKEKKDRLS